MDALTLPFWHNQSVRRGKFQWAAGLSGVLFVGCANPPPANQPKNDETDETTEATQLDEELGQSKSPSQKRALNSVCDTIVERATHTCKKSVSELYAASCRRYAKADKCQAEIQRALECQSKAKDEILCAHEADPNCTDSMRQLKACEKGVAPVEQTQAEDLTLPSGWAKIHDSQVGFVVALPRGAALDASAPKRTWKAEDSGLSYIVAVVDAPGGKLNNASILRTITNYVGTRCQLKLKVHGQLETKGMTVVQYDSGCTDGTEWHGMMHFWDGHAVSTGLHGASGNQGVLEPYYYSFSLSQ